MYAVKTFSSLGSHCNDSIKENVLNDAQNPFPAGYLSGRGQLHNTMTTRGATAAAPFIEWFEELPL